MSRVYRRTIEGWDLDGNGAWVTPIAGQVDAFDLLSDDEQDRIVALFEASLPEEDAVIDVLPGERAYDAWKAERDAGQAA